MSQETHDRMVKSVEVGLAALLGAFLSNFVEKFDASTLLGQILILTFFIFGVLLFFLFSIVVDWTYEKMKNK